MRLYVQSFVYALTSALAVVAMSASSNAAEAADASVILKDSFEEGDAAPTGWEQEGAVPGVEYSWADGEASDGERSLMLRKTEQRYFPIAAWSRTVPLKGNAANIEVSIKVKAEQAFKGVVDVVFLGTSGRPMGHKWIAYLGAAEENEPPADHGWGRYASVVKLPRGARRMAVQLQVYGPGTMWFDELEVRSIEAAGGATTASTETTRETANLATAETVDAASANGPIEIVVKDGAKGQYLLVPPKAEPAGLLIVLPGGDGSAEFHPFVSNIATRALAGKYAVAQPIAKKWHDSQEITWPALKNREPRMKFATEELVGKVIADVSAKHKIDRERIFLLAWSSGGPAAYAIALHKHSPVAGSLIAMSVFKPRELPALANAAKRNFYVLHSPQDEVCPYAMAHQAAASLQNAGGRVTLVDYAGGHGWHGDIFGNIATGMEWLEAGVKAKLANK